MKRYALFVWAIALLIVLMVVETSPAFADGPKSDKDKKAEHSGDRKEKSHSSGDNKPKSGGNQAGKQLVASTTAQFNASNFDNPLVIDNIYLPLIPGTTFIYDGKSDGEPTHEELVVTDRTKTILGIEVRIIRDRVWENGELVERTLDWFAQDNAGNVWYMGEFSTDLENGKVVSHEGSWKAGENGAEPGIVMEANPKVGDVYKQEQAPGIAEDTAEVLSLDESRCVAFGCFTNVLKTKEFTPLEPGVVEDKFYAPGVGQIREVIVRGGDEWSQLVAVETLQ